MSGNMDAFGILSKHRERVRTVSPFPRWSTSIQKSAVFTAFFICRTRILHDFIQDFERVFFFTWV